MEDDSRVKTLRTDINGAANSGLRKYMLVHSSENLGQGEAVNRILAACNDDDVIIAIDKVNIK